MHRAHAWAAAALVLALAGTRAHGTSRVHPGERRHSLRSHGDMSGGAAGDTLQTYAVDWAKVETAPTARVVDPQSAVTCGCDVTLRGCATEP
jgi:hypothetical protein